MATPEQHKSPRRKSAAERVIIEAAVHYGPVQENRLSGLCRDLSIGGLYLKTDFPFDVDETFPLSFSIPNKEQDISISCHARVAWTNDTSSRCKPGYPPGVGLQFRNLSKKDMATLSRFIESYDEDKKMNVVCAWCGNFLGLRKGPFGVTSHGICDPCRETMDH